MMWSVCMFVCLFYNNQHVRDLYGDIHQICGCECKLIANHLAIYIRFNHEEA